MEWSVEYTDEFEQWWSSLSEKEQESIDTAVGLVETKGPSLGFPYSSSIRGSKVDHLRELRIQHKGRPLRVLYAFDPRRCALLILGGDKTGDDRWYEIFVPRAEKLYKEHLETLRKEGLIDD